MPRRCPRRRERSHLWLTSRPSRDDAAGAAAHRDALALGATRTRGCSRPADRLAAISPLLAQRYYRHAAAAWSAFGPAGFERWLALGEELATGEPVCREAALAFFAARRRSSGRGGLATAAAWVRLGARACRHLAAAGGDLPRRRRPRSCAGPTRSSASRPGSRSAAVSRPARRAGRVPRAGLFLGVAARRARALPADYRLWAGAGAALHPAVSERDFLGALGARLAAGAKGARTLPPHDARARAGRAESRLSPSTASCPRRSRASRPTARAALLRVFAHLGPRPAAPLAEIGARRRRSARRCPPRASLARCARGGGRRALPEATRRRAPRRCRALFETARPRRCAPGSLAGLRSAEDRDAGARLLRARIAHQPARAPRRRRRPSLEDARGCCEVVQMVSGAPASVRAVRGPDAPPAARGAAGRERGGAAAARRRPSRRTRTTRASTASSPRRSPGAASSAPTLRSAGGWTPKSPPGSALLAYLDAPGAPRRSRFLPPRRGDARAAPARRRVPPDSPPTGARSRARSWSLERAGAPTRTERLRRALRRALLGGEPPRGRAGSRRAAPARRASARAARRRRRATVEDSFRVAEALAARGAH